MKKDIQIPEVKEVYIAAVKEFNEKFRAEEWNVYIINNRSHEMETVLLLTRGSDGFRQTSTMRHKLEKLPPKSFARVEYLQDEVLALDNEVLVTFFADEKMYERKFLFKKNSINPDLLRELPVIPNKGILAE